MLTVSIHAGSFDELTRYNRVAVLSIVYEELKPTADYKVVLQESALDVKPPRILRAYPRWSASLWDLVARALSLAIPDELPASEAVPAFGPKTPKKRPFLNELTVLLEHSANNCTSLLGIARIRQAGRQRGTYTAHFEEHTMKPQKTGAFEFAPASLRPAELLLHACLHRLTGAAEFPERPKLCNPPSLTVDGLEYIQIHQLVEPARTGFQNWLLANSEAPRSYPGARLGIAPKPIYGKFLHVAI